MDIPILKSCDIPERENQKEFFVIDNLSYLVKEDLHISKISHHLLS